MSAILSFRNIAETIQIFNSWDLVFLFLCSYHAVRKMGKCIQIIQSTLRSQAGIKIARKNIKNLRYADDTTPVAESEEELKNPLMKVKEESEKAGLKFNIPESKIMASSPITSWQIDGETKCKQ